MTTAKSTDQSSQARTTPKAPGVKSQEKTTSGNNLAARPQIVNPSRTAPQPPKDFPPVQLELFDDN